MSTSLFLPLALVVSCFMGMGPVVDVTETEYQMLQPLQPLDARVEDMTVLGTSLRVESPGLALPSDFDQVYRVPGDPNKLMRVNGALYAVFTQSTYGNYKGYVYAQVPPATVFHIGAPPSVPTATESVEPMESIELESSNRVKAGYGTVAPVGPGMHSGFLSAQDFSEEELPRFVADKEYRVRRLSEIVARRINRSDDQ